MKATPILFAISIALFVTFSCKKDTSTTNAADHFSSLDEFYQKSGAPVQSFTINADAGGNITGSGGTVITFPAKCFISRNGNMVTGNVTVDLREIYSEKDMVLSGMSTNSDNQSLSSAGEYYLKAYQNGQQVFVSENTPYKVKFSSQFTGAMSGYCAITNQNPNWFTPTALDTFGLDTSFTNQNCYMQVYDSAEAYLCHSDWMGWCNSDCPCDNGNDSINCYINQFSDFAEVKIIFTYNNSNSVAVVFNPDQDRFYWDYAPDDASGYIVALGLKKDDTFCCAVVPYDLSSQHDYNVTLNPTTAAAFNTLLNQLH